MQIFLDLNLYSGIYTYFVNKNTEVCCDEDNSHSIEAMKTMQTKIVLETMKIKFTCNNEKKLGHPIELVLAFYKLLLDANFVSKLGTMMISKNEKNKKKYLLFHSNIGYISDINEDIKNRSVSSYYLNQYALIPLEKVLTKKHKDISWYDLTKRNFSDVINNPIPLSSLYLQ